MITELEGKKDELLAQSYELREKIKEYDEENNTRFNDEVANLEAAKSLYEQQALDAIGNKDYSKAKEMLKKCEDLKSKINQIGKEYKNKQNPYREEYDQNEKKYKECQKEIEEAKAFAKEIEENFRNDCEESLEEKEQALAKVENNKMFDKIKGFLSKSVLNNINRTKKFKENKLVPLKNNVERFAKSVPEKVEKLEEKAKSKFKSLFAKGKDAIVNTKDKVHNAIDAAYKFGVDTVTKGRESAILSIEKKIQKYNEKVETLKQRNLKLEEKKENASMSIG